VVGEETLSLRETYPRKVGSGKLAQMYEGHASDVHAVGWSPDGKRFVSAGFEVRVWEAP